MSLWCFPSSFGTIQLTVWEEKSFEQFQDGRKILANLHLYVAPMSFEQFQDGHGGHLGYHNWTILAILNLYVTVMPPIKCWLNLTYGLGEDVVWRISRWPPSWISERNDFSNSESLCRSNASHQVLAQSDLRFGRRCRLKNFKMAVILDIGTERY